MRRFFLSVLVILMSLMTSLTMPLQAQQVPNADFEDWSGEKFDGHEQPKYWNASNVEQMGVKANFAHKEVGHNGGYCMMVQDQDVGAMSITETSPGYFSLGKVWLYFGGITNIGASTAGTEGGISWTYRPDTMSVWIKRTGNNTDKEDFYLLYYAWKGQSKGETYKNKDGGCSSTTHYDEEADIRQALNPNGCGTKVKATQIAEGMWREKKTYGDWTNIRVPIYYFNDEIPEKVNVLFSASNYPNGGSSTGLYAGNSLYVDDVELIYSPTIQKLYIGDVEWKGFDPKSTAVQYYSLGENATSIPSIVAKRGAGTLTNARGESASFSGRTLSGSEISITKGDLENKVTTIKVTAQGGKTMTYQIQFQRAASSNAKLAGISYTIGGTTTALPDFSPSKTNYTVELPYGTTATPVISAEAQENGQDIKITQPTSVTGTAKIVVTAPNKQATMTYNLTFRVAELADNTLQDIKVNNKSIPGFTPSQTVYRVSLPVGTSTLKVEPVSAYPSGAQTIVVTPNPLPTGDAIDGASVSISVTTPGNTVAKVYKLNIKLEASSYSYLENLEVEGYDIGFEPERKNYSVRLPMGTIALPRILYTRGDEYQTVEITSLPDGVVDGTVRVTVTAGNGTSTTVYQINFSSEKSEISTLKGIKIGGEPLADFAPDKTNYTYELPIGTTELPSIEPIPGDEYQTVEVTTGGVNGKTRITVTAGNGSTTVYQITFSVATFSDNTLAMIYLDGQPLEGFEPETNEYWVNLPKGTQVLPEVTYTLKDPEFQTVTVRAPSDLNGDYKITVRPSSGASRTYIIHFSLDKSTNTALAAIYLDGELLPGFHPDTLHYIDSLPEGVSRIPNVTYDKAEAGQRVLSILENSEQTITVTAESGATRTYIIEFIIRVSQNAYLDMIYLDGEPLEGFDRETLDYEVQLSGTRCPVITVDKAAGQQVTITAPYGAGEAQIKVQPGAGSPNTYRILFKAVAAATVQLAGILIDGMPLVGFEPTKLHYDASYSKQLPHVEGMAAGEEQTVSETLWNDSTAWIHVSDTTGSKAAYSVTFHRVLVTDNMLEGIYADGVLIAGFKPEVLQYAYTLPAGSTYPTITYKAGDETQVVFFGQTGEGEWGIQVAAENGLIATYTVQYTVAKYSDVTLANLEVAGMDLAYDPAQTTYNLTIDDGARLPEVIATPKTGQTIMTNTVNANQQEVLVIAQNGEMNTYTIQYTRRLSSDATLQDILLDGESLTGFAPDKYEYIDSLEWRTSVVPNIFPIAKLDNQTITTEYCRPNGTAKITVEAQDGTKNYYSITFPVRKSGNVKLDYLMLGDAEVELVPAFDADITEYTVTMPFGSTACAAIEYAKSEPEQRIDLISRPLGQSTEITVVAEDGSTRTYTVLFQEAQPVEDNVLSSISIIETAQKLDLTDKNVRDFVVNMPYGSRSMTVSYNKNYDNQTVFVQPGGLNHPTIITVKANRGDEEDAVYTITPNVASQNPAVLTSILIDGVQIAEYDKNRFTYVVNREDVSSIPMVTFDKEDAVKCQTEQDLWHWTGTVTCQGYTNVYKIFWHYPNEKIPNGEFTQWVRNAKNSADKPEGWNATNDYVSGYYSADYVTKLNDTRVELYNHGHTTLGWAAVNGCAPAILNLAEMTASHVVSGSSKTIVKGTVDFHNTPDKAIVNYAYPEIDNSDKGAVFRFYFLDNNNQEIESRITRTTTRSTFSEESVDLPLAGQKIKGFDVIIDASSASLNGGTGDKYAKLQVDYVRFSYNSTPKAVNVNGVDAKLSGKVFTVTLTDPEDRDIRFYEFNGEVVDQAQKLTWSEPTKDANYESRKAVIRNYAEDGSYTDGYSLVVKRPLDTKNQLADLKLNGVTIKNFNAATYSYTDTLSSKTRIPDIMPVAASSLETITTSYDAADSTMTITVTSEKGDTKTYTVKFVTKRSSDTKLADIVAEGITFDAAQTEYEVEAQFMPLIKCVKNNDMQTVVLQNGVITVTAEDGTQGTYTIVCTAPEPVVTGVLKAFYIDGQPIEGFGADQTAITASKPSQPVTFERETATDSVAFVQTPAYMQWNTVNKSYTYTYPTSQSSVATLSKMMVNGEEYDQFNPNSTDTILLETETTQSLQMVGTEDSQTISTTMQATEDGVIYSTTVEAEDGTTRQYTVKLSHTKSTVNTLAGILLDSVLINGFRPDSTDYTITLPAPEYKTAEPQMPSVTYETGHPGQKVTVTPSLVFGEPTTIVVEPETGTAMEYTVTVLSEKSSFADLSGITVNGEAIDHFEPGRHFYSVSITDTHVEIGYTSKDAFQTVVRDTTVIKENQHYTYGLNVIAENGITSNYYQVEVYIENKSNDAQLANITLDGLNFSAFYPDLNNNLSFDPGNNLYRINLPSGTTVLPEVSAQLKMEGQTVEIEQVADTIFLKVKAVDGTPNQYTLCFLIPHSKNANLSMIYLNGDSLSGFDPNTYFYQVTLPVGVHELPEVVAVKAESVQTIVSNETDAAKMETVIRVQAEDHETRINTYVIVYRYTYSDADTLNMIYEDGAPLPGFAPSVTYYSYELPVGTEDFPVLDYEQADDWQEVRMDTLEATPNKLIRQLTVAAESGKRNFYTVSYTILKSDVDTLHMLYVDQKPLPDFEGTKQEYYYTLTIAHAEELGGEVPMVEYTEGDDYQSVMISEAYDAIGSKSLGKKSVITVTAATGSTRVYTIHYPVELSSEAKLEMIMVGGQPLENYDEEITSYQVEIAQDAAVPAVSVVKKEDVQTYDIRVEADTITVEVTAEDLVTEQTYTIVFKRRMSDNTSLRDIILRDAEGVQFSSAQFPFRPDVYEYLNIALPYAADKTPEEQMPSIEIVLADTLQHFDTAHYLLPNEDIQVDITVTAPNEEDQAVYSLTFHFVKPSDAKLTAIMLNGELLADFDAAVTEYTFVHPFGTEEEAFYTPEDVAYILSDSLATDEIMMDENHTIIITVVAQDGVSEASYFIYQTVGKDSNNNLKWITLNGEMLSDFDPEVTFYTHLLFEGAPVPEVDAEPESENADWSKIEVSDTCKIICTAADGSKKYYYILFAVSPINDGIEASSTDVLVKRIPGTTQIQIVTLRKNVSFAMYDQNGHMTYYNAVPVADPNDAEVYTDANGSDVLNDVTNPNAGLIVDVIPGQIYFYSFFVSDKKDVKRGKFMIIN